MNNLIYIEHIHMGTRTPNLKVRSLARYPLRYIDVVRHIDMFFLFSPYTKTEKYNSRRMISF
jgi:hypothetical protein